MGPGGSHLWVPFIGVPLLQDPCMNRGEIYDYQIYKTKSYNKNIYTDREGEKWKSAQFLRPGKGVKKVHPGGFSQTN